MECVGRATDFKEGVMAGVELPGDSKSRHGKSTRLLVVRKSGRIYAIEDSCAHKSAKLHRGDIEDLGAEIAATVGDPSSEAGGLCVRCPKHQRKFCGGLWFNLATGKSYINGTTRKYKSEWRQQTYATEVRSDGNLFVSREPVPWRKIRDGCDDSGKQSTGNDGATKAPGLSCATTSGGEADAVEETTSSINMGTAEARGGDSQQWALWSIARIDRCSHDTSVFWFVPWIPSTENLSDAKPRVNVQTHEQRVAALKSLHNHVSWHLSMRLHYRDVAGMKKSVDREYTPLSNLDEWVSGSIRILIKVYPKGKLTSRLAQRQIGDNVELGLPETTLALPWLQHARVPRSLESPNLPTLPASSSTVAPGSLLLLIAGGTGIAPMWQLSQAVLAHNARTDDPIVRDAKVRSTTAQWPTRVMLVCSNRTEEDMLLGWEVHTLAKAFPSQMIVVHTLTREKPAHHTHGHSPPAPPNMKRPRLELGTMFNSCAFPIDIVHSSGTETGSSSTSAHDVWTIEQGRVSASMLARHVDTADILNTTAIVSGPEGMWTDVSTALHALGCDKNHIHELEA